MLRNYFNIAYRTLLKNKVFTLINVVGLALGTAAFLLIAEYVRFEQSYEAMHQHADHIYRITLDIYKGNELEVTDCETHAGIGPLLKETSAKVSDFVRMYHKDGVVNVKIDTETFLEEQIYFADSSVFDIFTIDILHGSAHNALRDPFGVVINESLANKYFGSADRAIGKTLEVDRIKCHVTAVMGDLSPNTHLKFSMLLSHTTLPKINRHYDDWGGNNEYTYLLMAPGTKLDAFNEELKNISKRLEDKIGDSRYTAEGINSIHLHSNKSFEPEVNGSHRVVLVMIIIAVFIIVIAWINYVNLATARAIERAREVGIRKVVGSARIQLMLQFLMESMVINLMSIIVALGAFQVSLPLFRALAGQPIVWGIAMDLSFWMIVAILFVIGTLLSGLYPAFILSGFKPVQVLKGKFRSSEHGQRLRQALVIAQFSAAVVLIIGVFTVYFQVQHMRQHDLGLNASQTLIIRAPQFTSDSIRRSGVAAFKTEVLRHPEVTRIASSEALPGLSVHEMNTTTMERDGGFKGSELTMYFFSVDEDFIPTMEMTLMAGRNFTPGTKPFEQVILNEEAVRRFGFESPDQAVGSRVRFSGSGMDAPMVIGVLKNFHQRSPKEEHLPMMFAFHDAGAYFSLRLSGNDVAGAVSSVKDVWDHVFPNSLFSYYFLDESFNQQYQGDIRFGQVIGTFSGLAIFLACLGLFGLSSYTIVQRTKEIGIRKVLGASVGHIVQLLSFHFVKVVLVGALVAIPLAYVAMESWLSNYVVRIHMHAGLFVFPVILILLMVLITVSLLTVKAALANPTNSLRQE